MVCRHGHCIARDVRDASDRSLAASAERARDGLTKSQMETTSRGELDATGFDEPTWAWDRRVDVVLAGSQASLGARATRLSSSAK
jgi:hypothetical protein